MSTWSGGCLDRLDAWCFGFCRRRSAERDEAPQRRVVSNWDARWTRGGFGNVSRIGPRGPRRPGAALRGVRRGRHVLFARLRRDARPRWRCGRLSGPGAPQALRRRRGVAPRGHETCAESLVCKPRLIYNRRARAARSCRDLLHRAACKALLAAGTHRSVAIAHLVVGTQPRALRLQRYAQLQQCKRQRSRCGTRVPCCSSARP